MLEEELEEDVDNREADGGDAGSSGEAASRGNSAKRYPAPSNEALLVFKSSR